MPTTDRPSPKPLGPALPSPPDEVPARPDWFQSRPTLPAPEPLPPERWSFLWLTDRDVLVCLTLAAVLLILLAVDWNERAGWAAPAIEIERSEAALRYRIDLNAATWVEFAQLEGIGPALGRRIVEDRRANGPFPTIDALDRVKGIGPKTLARLRPHVRVETPPLRTPR